MKSAALILFAATGLAACSSADEVADELGQGTAAADVATAGGVAGSGAAVALERESDDYVFGYSWPRAAGQHEKLAARLQAEANAAEAELARVTAEERAGAEAEGFPFRKHAFDKDWEVVGELPGWLSLKARIYTFSGGAHPNTGYDSLVWDKANATALETLDLFHSGGNLEQAVQRRFCELLNGERARRRGQLVAQDSEDPFDQCPGIDELTVLLRSSDGKKFTKVGLIAAPYVAGPYAEGPYEFTLSVDSSVIDAVKPEYLELFARGP